MNILNAMGPGERQKVVEIIDYTKIASLSSQISETAQRCSEISKKLSSDNTGNEQERKNLSAELSRLIKKGSELSEERAQIFARNIE